jgi:hypothetical protein
MESVYIETTIVSLLVGNPSRDLITAANQQATRDWWHLRKHEFFCVTSAEVIREASQGDPNEIRKRHEVLQNLALLAISSEAEALAKAFLETGAMPRNAQSDATHLAVSSVSEIDYLLTWNCRHLANAQILRRLEVEAVRKGWKLPKVCTPLELMGDLPYETGSDS